MPLDQPVDRVQDPIAPESNPVDRAALELDDSDGSAAASFRERLNAIEMR
jgi:hypothetical protein